MPAYWLPCCLERLICSEELINSCVASSSHYEEQAVRLHFF